MVYFFGSGLELLLFLLILVYSVFWFESFLYMIIVFVNNLSVVEVDLMVV